MAKTPANSHISEMGAAESAALDPKHPVYAAQSPDFAASLSMIAALPLSAEEKAQAVRALLASKILGVTQANTKGQAGLRPFEVFAKTIGNLTADDRTRLAAMLTRNNGRNARNR